MRWKIECENFVNVRQMIRDEVDLPELILEGLQDCCDEILTKADDDWDFTEAFIEFKEDVEENINDVVDMSDIDECEDIVDGVLNDFYDLCDAAMVWLGL